MFNGDNKQKEVRDANNNVVGTYSYDGTGARVKKIIGNDDFCVRRGRQIGRRVLTANRVKSYDQLFNQ